MKARFLALTVLFVGAAIATATPLPAAIVALALPLVALVVGPRLRLDRVGQAGLSMGALVLGILVPRLLVGPELARENAALLSERALLFAMPMLALAAARALVHAPVFGDRLTLLAALVALTAAGRSLAGIAYPLLAFLPVCSGLVALYVNDRSRPKLRLLGRRHVGAVVFGVGAAIGLSLLAAWSLPILHDMAVARLLDRWNRNRTGFSDQMFLGDMAGMLQSDTVVMRLRGGAPPLLRGAVFTGYAAGIWEVDREPMGLEVLETPTLSGGRRIEIENARKSKRYFLPLGARDVAVSSGIYERDAMRIHRASLGFEAKRIWFYEGEGPEPLAARAIDLQIPRRIKPALVELLHTWGIENNEDPRARVEAMVERLTRDYRYSLDYDRRPHADPVLDFLLRSREGHCEYFASALALLARASGIPARVVGGYRVVESSPFGYAVVRERHAHSWVEVWLDGHWVTADPTPAGDLALASPARTPWLSALWDGISTGWERVDDWLARRSPFELSLMLVGLVGLLITARLLRGRGAGQRGGATEERPLPGFVALTAALSKRGVTRGAAETLSRFIARIEADVSLLPDERASVAELLRRYAQLRYAGQGNGDALDREMSDASRSVRGARSPTGVS